MTPGDEKNRQSTLVLKGAAAFTFGDMQAFAQEIASRPIDRLVADFSPLLALADNKFTVFVQALRKRLRAAGEDERNAVFDTLRGLARGAADVERRERARKVLEELGEPLEADDHVKFFGRKDV